MTPSTRVIENVGPSLIATAIASALGFLLAYILGVPGIISIWGITTAGIILALGLLFSFWKGSRLFIQTYALGFFVLLLMSALVIFNLLVQDQVCDKVRMTAEKSRAVVKAPPKGKDSDFIPIIYKVVSPSTTGFTILLHTAEFLSGDGDKRSLGGEGRNTDQYGVHVGAGQELQITNDGISIPSSVLDAAEQANTSLITERKIFHLVSDKNVYCKASAEVVVEVQH